MGFIGELFGGNLFKPEKDKPDSVDVPLQPMQQDPHGQSKLKIDNDEYSSTKYTNPDEALGLAGLQEKNDKRNQQPYTQTEKTVSPEFQGLVLTPDQLAVNEKVDQQLANLRGNNLDTSDPDKSEGDSEDKPDFLPTTAEQTPQTNSSVIERLAKIQEEFNKQRSLGDVSPTKAATMSDNAQVGREASAPNRLSQEEMEKRRQARVGAIREVIKPQITALRAKVEEMVAQANSANHETPNNVLQVDPEPQHVSEVSDTSTDNASVDAQPQAPIIAVEESVQQQTTPQSERAVHTIHRLVQQPELTAHQATTEQQTREEKTDKPELKKGQSMFDQLFTEPLDIPASLEHPFAYAIEERIKAVLPGVKEEQLKAVTELLTADVAHKLGQDPQKLGAGTFIIAAYLNPALEKVYSDLLKKPESEEYQVAFKKAQGYENYVRERRRTQDALQTAA